MRISYVSTARIDLCVLYVHVKTSWSDEIIIILDVMKIDLNKSFLKRLWGFDYGKLKDTTKFLRRNKSWNFKKNLNRGWMMSFSIEGLWGVNQTRQGTGLRYIHSEVVQQAAILTIWDHYLSNAHVEREVWRWWVESVFFCESGFLDVILCRFVDILKTIIDKRPI